jgi:hypothetical protein
VTAACVELFVAALPFAVAVPDTTRAVPVEVLPPPPLFDATDPPLAVWVELAVFVEPLPTEVLPPLLAVA